MDKQKETFVSAWKNRKGPAVFTTVSKANIANSIYVSSIEIDDEANIIIADNYFLKTNQNIADGSKGVVLFITNDDKSYQAKGTITCHKTGPTYDFMKSWNPTKHPGHRAVVLQISELYSGVTQII